VEQVFTVTDVAHAAGVASATVQYWVRTGRLSPRFRTVGAGIKLFAQADVQRAIAERALRKSERSGGADGTRD
jgi:DNA-binding transcriptional MerR regulator